MEYLLSMQPIEMHLTAYKYLFSVTLGVEFLDIIIYILNKAICLLFQCNRLFDIIKRVIVLGVKYSFFLK